MIALPKLNFSEQYPFKIIERAGVPFIWDEVRKDFFKLTPEEWVRQHLIQFFLTEGYSLKSIIVEKKIKLHRTTKRLDVLVMKQAKPFILCECKAPDIPLTNKTLEQVVRYNLVVDAEQILITNGLLHRWFNKNADGGYTPIG